MYSSLGKIDLVTRDPVQYIQTDHRSRDEIEAEPELSVLFAMTRVLKARAHAETEGVAATIVYAAFEDDLPPFLREALAAVDAVLERASDRTRETLPPAERTAAQLADEAFRGLAERVTRRTGLSEPVLALRSLEAETAVEPPSPDEDEILYWTRVLELAALTGEVLRAKRGGAWEVSNMADVPFGFTNAHGTVLATNRAQRFLADGEAESMFLLLGNEDGLYGEEGDAGDGPVMPSLRSREDALRDNMAFQPLHDALAEAGDVPVIAYGIDHPQSFAITIDGPDVDVAALHAKAIANVAREEVELERVDVENVEMIAVSGSFYAAEKLLDRAFMRRLHGMLGAEILAASVPRRGLLLVVAANPEDPASLALLGAATEAESKTTRAISEAMLVITDGQVVGRIQIERRESPETD